MSTSGSTDFSLNRNSLITEAFALIGIGMEGEDLSASMISDASRTLNIMVKSLQKDVDLWIKTLGSLPLVASQQSYTMGSGGDFSVRPLRILEARLRQSSVDTPMIQLSRQEYFDLSLKTATGLPTNFYYDRQLTQGVLYVWPTLASGQTGTIEFTYARSLEDFDNSTDDPDFPQEWFEALSYNLAVRLSDKYGGLTPQVEARAISSLAQVEAWDEDDESIFLQPEFI